MSELSAAIRVLHVDDEPDFGELAATFLEREDEHIEVETATSAAEGLDRLDDDVDCVVSDYDMPGRNGIEFLEQVRDGRPDLPFILFTGKGSEEIASDAISAGVTDYLQKSGGTDQYAVLANRIRNAVDQYRAEQRLRQRERELERQNRRLTALFENFPEPTFGYVYEDDEPHIASVNEAFTEVFGYSVDEAVGQPVDDLIVPPDKRDEAERLDERVRSGESMDEVLRRETSDGMRDFWFRNIQLPGDEQLDGYAIYADVTAQKQHERELERYQNIVEASGDPVYTLDADGRCTFINSAFVEMTGYSESELLGADPSLVLTDEDRQTVQQLIRSLVADDDDRVTTELDLIRADGERVPCEAHITLLPYEDEFRGTVGVVRDISDRKQRERELRRERDRLDER